MRGRDRVVVESPLRTLWGADGEDLRLTQAGTLDAEALRRVMRGGAPRFVVAEAGRALLWVDRAEAFDFWKSEVRPRVADPRSGAALEDYPGQYCYFATEWTGDDGPVILLTKHH